MKKKKVKFLKLMIKFNVSFSSLKTYPIYSLRVNRNSILILIIRVLLCYVGKSLTKINTLHRKMAWFGFFI